MAVRVRPLRQGNVVAEAIEASWDGGQFVVIIAPKGVLACGVVDPVVMNRFGAAVAVARGTPQQPLVTAEDLLGARVVEVTDAAAARGITPGMAGAAALEKLA